MHRKRFFRRWGVATGLAALAGVTTVALVVGSDHQDTPFVELNPKSDLTDVYAFPGAAPERIVLVMDTRAFLTPAEAQDPAQASFDSDLLYQFKIDNFGDAKEDKCHPGDLHRRRDPISRCRFAARSRPRAWGHGERSGRCHPGRFGGTEHHSG